jgi:hypothetical protein
MTHAQDDDRTMQKGTWKWHNALTVGDKATRMSPVNKPMKYQSLQTSASTIIMPTLGSTL